MLASTMHISTNNQPTPASNTHTAAAAVCVVERDRRRSPKPNACSFRTQQGAKQPAQPHHSPFSADPKVKPY
jgi:hypothetical protein